MHHPQIALQKTVCLFFVILGHALLPFASPVPFWKIYAETQAAGADGIAMLLVFTVIPSFLFASGFLLEQSLQNAPSSSKVAEKRILRLFVPWVLLLFFWLVPLYTLLDIPAYNRPAGTPFWETLLAGLQGRFTEHLWFLLVLFWVSLFWIAARPILERAPKPACLTAMSKPDLSPWLTPLRAKLDALKPEWIRPEWFTLSWEAPKATFFDFAGLGLALVAAITLQLAGKNLTWYCLHASAGPLLFLYCGMLAYRHRDWLDAFLLDNGAKVFPLLAVPFLLLLPFGHAHFLLSWLLGILGALLTYQVCLLLVRIGFTVPTSGGVVAFFAGNAFRFYLFHLPTSLLVFMGLNKLDIFSPWLCVIATTILTLLVTAGIVQCSHLLEQTQLPKIAARMRPQN